MLANIKNKLQREGAEGLCKTLLGRGIFNEKVF